ncbi:hypothetical protein [Streptomyces sp. URMC 129]|uniref:hypothetical protein n=1 Tax=Streptomyces sp. URMC 129 TaxID=3423407 RepID=UPI003F19711E
MKRTVPKRVAASAVAALAAIALPAAPARAADPLPCAAPAACVWSGQDGTGLPGVLLFPEFFLIPPILSARNESGLTWCLFADPFYTGARLELDPGETIRALPYPARSAAPGDCPG